MVLRQADRRLREIFEVAWNSISSLQVLTLIESIHDIYMRERYKQMGVTLIFIFLVIIRSV